MSRFVQSKTGDFSHGTAGAVTFSLAFDSPVTSGTLLIAFVNENDSDASNVPTVSDGVNGAWTEAVSAVFDDLTGDGWFEKQSLWYLRSPAAGATTVQVAWAGGIDGTFASITIAEYTAAGDFIGAQAGFVEPSPDADKLQAIDSPALVVGTPALVIGAFGNDDRSIFIPGTGVWGAPVEQLSINDRRFTTDVSDYEPTGVPPFAAVAGTTISQDAAPPVAPPVGTTAMKIANASHGTVSARLKANVVPFPLDGDKRWRLKGQYLFRTAEGGATRAADFTPGVNHNVPFAAVPEGWNDINAPGTVTAWGYGTTAAYDPVTFHSEPWVGFYCQFVGSLSSCAAWVTDLGIELATFEPDPTPWIQVSDTGRVASFARAMLMHQDATDGVSGTFTAVATTIDGTFRSGAFVAAFEALAEPPPPPSVAFLPSGIERPGPFRLFAADRGGVTLLDELRPHSLSFQRRLNQQATAMATVTAGGSGVLGGLRSYAHELVIVQDDDVVWAGPIIKPTWNTSDVTLPAVDLGLGWLNVRDVVNDHVFIDHDVAAIADALVTETLERENSMGLTVIHHVQGVGITEQFQRIQGQKVGDALRSLASKGLLYTTQVRKLLLGPVHEDPLIFTDDSFVQPSVAEGDVAAKVSVIGAQTAGVNVPVVGHAGGISATSGLVEKTINDPRSTDTATAIIEAEAAVAVDPPVTVSGTLKPAATLDFNRLICGRSAVVRLNSLDRVVEQTLVLLQVDVNIQNGSAAVSVTLGPLGLA